MKNFFLFLFILLLAGATFLAVGVFALTANPLDDWQGSVELNIINADVSVKQGNLDYQIITESILLAEGDMVKTGRNAEAEILIADGAIIRLAENTELVINKANLESLWEQDINVAVNQGKIWFRIIKIFDEGSSWEVETPTIVATVRGTAFGIEVLNDEEVDLLVAESEVYIREKGNTVKAKQAVAVAGQRMKVGQGFAVSKDQLNLSDKADPDLRIWLNKNLESDKKFQEKTKQKINAEILKSLKEEPGTLIHEAQLWAEKIRLKISDEDTIKRIEDLQEKRRMAETLWLVEKGEDKKLQELLKRPEIKSLRAERLDKLPQLMINPEVNIKNLFNNQDLNNNIFDIKTLENRIQDLDLNNISDRFDLELNSENIKTIKEKLDRLSLWVRNHPELEKDSASLKRQIAVLLEEGTDALIKIVKSPEYIKLMKLMNGSSDSINTEEGPNFENFEVLSDESFEDIILAMNFIEKHPEIQKQIDLVSMIAEEISDEDNIAIEGFFKHPEYLNLLDMLENVPGYIGPVRIVELYEINTIQLLDIKVQ